MVSPFLSSAGGKPCIPPPTLWLLIGIYIFYEVGQPKPLLEHLDPFGGPEPRLEGGCRSAAQGQPLPTGRQAEPLDFVQGVEFVERQPPAFMLGSRRVDNIQSLYVYFIRREVGR